MNDFYISGPMRGYKHFNFPAFYQAEAYLVQLGYKRNINPARKDVEEYGFDLEPDETVDITADMLHQWMRRDISDVTTCASLLLLPGWAASEGAKREAQVALWCGVHIYQYDPQQLLNWRLNFASAGYVAAVLRGTSLPVDNDPTVTSRVKA